MADKASKSSKRRVKNPETFRDRAVKANTETTRRFSMGRLLTAPRRWLVSYLRQLLELKALGWLKKPLKLIGKILLPVYFRNSWRELKQVTWPSWKQSRQLTFAVLAFAIVFGFAIAAVDYGLDRVFKALLLK